MEQEKREKNTMKDYFSLGEVAGYFFRKKSAKKPNINIRMMHGINKISILIFLLALIVWTVRRLF